jgi:hypothetical protein
MSCGVLLLSISFPPNYIACCVFIHVTHSFGNYLQNHLFRSYHGYTLLHYTGIVYTFHINLYPDTIFISQNVLVDSAA